MRVLIADDEERYRDYLRASLAAQGHDVSTVDAGRVAIDHGVRFRPQVLVTDWMLSDDIHGLRVSSVLRAVDPSLRAIVITGFPSTDLQRDARHSGVFRFIEKPFELEEMVEAVNSAGATKYTGAMALFGLIEVDSRGRIVNTNCKSHEMLARTVAGTNAQSLDELFGADAITHLVESNEQWVRIQPTALGGHELGIPPVERQPWIAIDIGSDIPKTRGRIEKALPRVRRHADHCQRQIRGDGQPADLQRLRPLQLLPDKTGENDEGRNEVDKHPRAKRMPSPPLALVHGHGERV